MIALLSINPTFSQSVLDKVDLFICTDGDHGQLDPAATAPFGMMKLGPDNDPIGHSGYNYSSNIIKGFSHNRIGGVGCSGAGGNLSILPSSASSLTFDKSTEKASPGYYAVLLDNNVKSEFTATQKTGIHKYTFPKSKNATLSFDLKSSFADFISADKKIINSQEFTTSVSAKNVCNRGRYTVHFHVWCNKEMILKTNSDSLLVYEFSTKKSEEVYLYVTVSSISQEDAQSHFNSISKNQSFEEVKRETASKWSNLLSRIEVHGKPEYEKLFYTHLYHIFLNPVVSENSKKQFKATDGNIYTSKGYTHYDTWSMWDNFRNKFSLYALIAPEVSADIANSLIDLFKYGKAYWSGFNEPTPTVRTEHSVITLLDMYQRGVTKFQLEPMYQKLSTEMDNIFENSPDTKLEKSYDYWALSEFAGILGKKDEQQLYFNQAMDYKKSWKKNFLKMDKYADIMHARGLYEGTRWQYRWHVQFDVPGIVEMMGGKDKFNEQLEYFFDNHLYNHGNQPDIHVPFMFNYGGKPWLTQKWVNKILTKDMHQYYGTHHKWKYPYVGKIYKAEPKGYISEMDDDEGTMSGWFVLSSLGMYPVQVGKPEFQLSAPIFEKVTIHLAEGKKFQIECNGINDESFYIKSASLNGKPFNKSFIQHSDIANGGKLIYNLSNEPNKSWGVE